MKLKTLLQEILNKTNGLDFETIRIQNHSNKTTIEARLKDKKTGFFYKAETKAPIEGVGECVIGLSDIGILSGIMSSRSFRKEGSDTTLKTKPNGTIEQIIFKDDGGMTFKYRVMDPRIIDSSRIPTFVMPDFECVFNTPDKEKVREMNDIANLMKGVHPKFVPQTENDKLVFLFGGEEDSIHTAKFTFADGMEKEINNTYYYPIDIFQRCLALTKDDPTTIKISDDALMVIESVSEILTSQYIAYGHTE